MSNDLTPAQSGNDPPLQTLISQLRDLVRDASVRALRAVDTIQVRTCREIGRHIVEFEQGGLRAQSTASGCCRDWLSR